MKRLRILSAFCVVASAFAACHSPAQHSTAQASVAANEVRTIDNIDPRPVVQDPPPTLKDEAAPPKPKGQPWEPPQPVALTTADEKMRAALPFSPAIAMDPIDGSKISILATTPMFEYKNHIYYFSSEENKREFAANPEQYAKGLFKGM